MTTTTTIDKEAVTRWDVAVWNNAVARNELGAWLEGVEAAVNRVTEPVRKVRPTAVSTDIASVMACLKRAESGDYSEQSHIYDGSGAYQVVPGTWREWSARAGYGGYAYAYEAPPAVQDAVVVFMLEHGGAHAWDPRFGRDSCTVGMP